MIYSEVKHKFFQDFEEAADELGPGEDLEDLGLVKCVPVYARPISTEEWSEDLPDDHCIEVPEALKNAVEAFNHAVAGLVLSWAPSDEKVDLSDWMAGRISRGEALDIARETMERAEQERAAADGTPGAGCGSCVVPRYYGESSRDVWERVGELPDGVHRDVVYTLGCALQDLESRFLQLLAAGELVSRCLPKGG